MAHYAELNQNNIVLRTIVISNDVEPTEAEGIAWCVAWAGGGTWIKCSYNGTVRKNYPGPGYSFDPDRDAFIAPKPFPSWLLDETTCQWGPPTSRPTEGFGWYWDEPTTSWKQPE